MFTKHVPAILAGLSFLCLSGVALAQSNCGPRADVLGQLGQRYKEYPHANGIINERALIEVYVSHKGTWTIVTTNDRGISCIMAAGQDWIIMPEPPKGEGT